MTTSKTEANGANRIKGVDVAIVGNGALGLALGVELVKRNCRVAVIGPSSKQWGASPAAGAMNGCFGEVTRELLSSRFGRMKLQMDVDATALWDDWIASLAEMTGTKASSARSKSGTTVILNTVGTSAVDSANFSAMQSALDEYQSPYELLDESEIDWLTPQDGARALKALHIAGEHSVNAAVYLPMIERAFVSAGGLLLNGNASDIPSKSGSVEGVTLDDGTWIPAKQVVLAAGVKSLDLLNKALPDVARYVPPMVSGYGISAVLKVDDAGCPSTVTRTPNRAFACGLHAVPREPGVLYVGATNIISDEPQTHAAIGDLHFLLGCALKQLHTDLVSARVIALQVGNRPVPVDGFPLIGEIGSTGIWMLTGTYRDGLHQSPLLATKLANRMLSPDSLPFVPDFSPVRRPLCMGSRQDIVQQAVTHMLATGYEADWNVPVDWPPRIAKHLERRYVEISAELHDTFTPPAEILVCAMMHEGIRSKLDGYYKQYN
ncbi:NAD(P)/FAD-dependent oxidoreductase [Bradyrhizobium sp. 930_D9_N1_4]|uniref:NAD(P)/FAD-dependent oxidoreductase n=1 Tax=Bradyrhizobium sp. 930_D9_N1_4 TaxID=3240374 RepID=UPI003F898E52